MQTAGWGMKKKSQGGELRGAGTFTENSSVRDKSTNDR